MNCTKYVNTLEKLKVRLLRVRSEKVSIIHHYNARPHTSLETLTALDRLGLRTLPHPLYSPDLAPRDFFLFPKLKDYLRGNRYETDEDVKNAVLSTRLLTSSLTASNWSSIGGGSVSNGTVNMLKNDVSPGAK
ncbi:transposase [Elysia marginata]|uniref:Transposase n=1 Tax=Elysia marginata TaxID=1093978 RepID=A0AAV4J3V4_9GAST|nr:transposase [Elysia marginata]